MTANDNAFTGPIPELYERFMVPMIFEPFARELSTRLAEWQPARVLETACGTGVLTRAIGRLLPEVRLAATDLNQAMLDEAIAAQPPVPEIVWRQADALALPFDPASFDAVVCQFGVMFFPDRVAGYREARRVLAPGGRFLFSAWDRIEANDFAAVVAETLKGIFPIDPPRFLQRLPHGYHDADAIRADLAAAGFTAITVESIRHVSRAPSAQAAATALTQANPAGAEIEARAPGRLADVTRLCAASLARRFGHREIEGRIEALVVTASG